MSGYVFHCSKCQFAHAGECSARLWRWTSNVGIPILPAAKEDHERWVARYCVGDRKMCEFRYGKPFGISDYTTPQVFDEKDLGVPQTTADHPYPTGAIYIPLEVWIEWQLSFKGNTRENALKNAYAPHQKIDWGSP